MPKSQHTWVRPQHPPTQWNLKGGRWMKYIKESIKKSKTYQISLSVRKLDNKVSDLCGYKRKKDRKQKIFSEMIESLSTPPILLRTSWSILNFKILAVAVFVICRFSLEWNLGHKGTKTWNIIAFFICMPLLPSLDLCNKKCDCVFWFLNDPKSNFCGYRKNRGGILLILVRSANLRLQDPYSILLLQYCITFAPVSEYKGEYANTVYAKKTKMEKSILIVRNTCAKTSRMIV